MTHRVLFRCGCRHRCSSSQHNLKSKNICTYIGVFGWKPNNSADQLAAIFNMRFFAPFPWHCCWHVLAEASNQLNNNNLLHSRWTVMRIATRQMCPSLSFSSTRPGNPFEPMNAVLHFLRITCTFGPRFNSRRESVGFCRVTPKIDQLNKRKRRGNKKSNHWTRYSCWPVTTQMDARKWLPFNLASNFHEIRAHFLFWFRVRSRTYA